MPACGSASPPKAGRYEVYAQRFPELGQRRPISIGGGFGPRWSADGRELFYLLAPGGGAPQAMMRVAIESDATTLTAGQPERLFDRTFYDQRGQHRRYDLSPDGRFLMIAQGADAGSGTSPSDLVFVLNWFSELQARVPTGQAACSSRRLSPTPTRSASLHFGLVRDPPLHA